MSSLAGPQNAHWNRYKGDTNDFVEVFVTGITPDLSGVTLVTGSVIKLSDPTVRVDGLVGSVVAPATDFKVKIVLGAWLTGTAVAGEDYELLVQLSSAGGVIQTWPDKGMAIISVK
jgi:hypothetical protein